VADAPDLIYTKASLHWVDGHEALFPRLFSRLKPGGCLAVQKPRNHDQPSHRAAFWFRRRFIVARTGTPA
jgi:trans-aconitate 2-methyltransferase